MSDDELVTLHVTLQDHGPTRESWGVATVLVREAHGELPQGFHAGVELKAVGDLIGMASAGERLQLRGRFESSNYGQQFRVVEQGSEGMKEPKEACRWLERLDGVGPKIASLMAERFGEQLLEVLSGETEADLTTIRGISEEKALHIRTSFQEIAMSGDLETVRYLDSIKASRYEANKIIAWCKKKRLAPIEVLEGSPFDLMDVKGLGWSRVDTLARRAGCPPAAPARIEAASLVALEGIVQQGSTMAPLYASRGGGLVGEAAGMLGLERDLIEAAVRRLSARGDVVLANDERGRTWVHPTPLLKAERAIYRAAKGSALPSSAPLREARVATHPQHSEGAAHGFQGQQEHGSRVDRNGIGGADRPDQPPRRGPGHGEQPRGERVRPRGGAPLRGGLGASSPAGGQSAGGAPRDPHAFGRLTHFWE